MFQCSFFGITTNWKFRTAHFHQMRETRWRDETKRLHFYAAFLLSTALALQASIRRCEMRWNILFQTKFPIGISSEFTELYVSIIWRGLHRNRINCVSLSAKCINHLMNMHNRLMLVCAFHLDRIPVLWHTFPPHFCFAWNSFSLSSRRVQPKPFKWYTLRSLLCFYEYIMHPINLKCFSPMHA